MIDINKQSYLAELAKLLGFMSAWDRRSALMKYEAMFEEAQNEEELIAELGSPTKLAIGLALNYVPSPAPESIAAPTVEPGENLGEFAAGAPEEAPVEEAPAAEAEEAPAEKADGAEEAAPVEEPAPVSAAKRRVRPFGLIVAILFGLVIGVPVALVLILVGVPFLVSGVATIAADVWAVLALIPCLSMISDILVVVGVGLVVCGFGLLLAWFGLWLSFELGYLWISGAVLRLGRALTYKKEVAAA